MAKGNRGGQGKKSTSQKISQAKDMKQLNEILNRANIPVSAGVGNQRFEDTKNALAGTMHVLEEFGATSFLKGVQQDVSGIMAAHRLTGTLYFNEKYFKTGGEDIQSMIQRVTKFSPTHWPKNQSAFTIGAHEAGHLVEGYLIQKSGGGYDTLVNRTIAKQIVTESHKELKAMYKAAGQKAPGINDAVGQISMYATKNRSETLAEAFADVVANKENAHPFSKIIWNKAKKMAGK